jgi:hypothetical protein
MARGEVLVSDHERLARVGVGVDCELDSSAYETGFNPEPA